MVDGKNDVIMWHSVGLRILVIVFKNSLKVSDEKLKKSTLIVTSVEDLIKPLEEYFKSGFTQIYLHSTSPDEIDFVQQFCKKVLPHFKEEKQK